MKRQVDEIQETELTNRIQTAQLSVNIKVDRHNLLSMQRYAAYSGAILSAFLHILCNNFLCFWLHESSLLHLSLFLTFCLAHFVDVQWVIMPLWNVPYTNGVYSHSLFLFTQHHFHFASCDMDCRAGNVRYGKLYFVFIIHQLFRYIQMVVMELQKQIPSLLLFLQLPVPLLGTVATILTSSSNLRPDVPRFFRFLSVSFYAYSTVAS